MLNIKPKTLSRSNDLPTGDKSSILLISATFPPRGGSGVQRVMYQSQYLTELGHEVWVVTEEPEKVWVSDDTLSPGSVPLEHIVRSKQYPLPLVRLLDRFLRRFAASPLYPDDFALWAISAYRKAAGLVLKRGLKTLLVSLGHPSALLVAYLLKRRFPQIKLVIDVRDLWTGSPVEFMGRNRRGIRQKLDQYCERSVFELTDAIITVSDGLKSDIQNRYPNIKASTHVIHNGYDEAVFLHAESSALASTASDRVRVVYTGFVIPEQKPEVFFSALSKLVQDSPTIAANLSVEFYGGSQAYIERLANEFGVTQYVKSYAYVSHSEAVMHMCNADLLLLFRVPHSGVLSGKLFEYMRSGTRILTFDQGNFETRRILQETGTGEWVSVDDVAGQIKTLRRLVSSQKTTRVRSECQNNALKYYSRHEQARRLSEIIESVPRTQREIDITHRRKDAA